MRRGAIRKVDIALPVELVGRIKVSGRRSCVAIAKHWSDVTDVEGSTLVPSIGCLRIRSFPICTFPNSSTELVGGIGGDDSYESLVDNVLPEGVGLTVADTGPIQACDDVVMPHSIR